MPHRATRTNTIALSVASPWDRTFVRPSTPSHTHTAARDMPEPTLPDAPMPRRRFLIWMSGIGAAFTALIVGAPAATAFFSPAFKRAGAKKWITVADDVSTLDIGVPIKVDFVDTANDAWVESRALRSVWLRTEDGEKFTAFSGVCTHLGCSIGYDADKTRYHCPCHHGLFDPKTGAVIGGPPPRPLDSLPVRIVDGEVQVLYQTFRTGIAAKSET